MNEYTGLLLFYFPALGALLQVMVLDPRTCSLVQTGDI